METNRYINAIDKLIDAFLKGQLRHGQECSCAVGNLCNNTDTWYSKLTPMFLIGEEDEETKENREKYKFGNYTGYEIVRIEQAFEGREFSELEYYNGIPLRYTYFTNNEDAIEDDEYRYDPDGFKGLQAAAEVLYQLDHKELEEQEDCKFNIFDYV